LKYDHLPPQPSKEGKWKKLLMKGTLINSKWKNNYFNLTNTGIKEKTIKTIHNFISEILKGDNPINNFRPSFTFT